MPSIASRLTDPSSVAIPARTQPGPNNGLPPLAPVAPGLSNVLRCPMPILATASTPDALRQFYAGGTIPQYRINPPAPLSSGGGGVTQIVSGDANVIISPASGTGVVTISIT